MRIALGLLLALYSVVSMAAMVWETFTCKQPQIARAFRVITVPIAVIMIAFASLGWFADEVMEWLMETESNIARFESRPARKDGDQ